MTDDGHKDPLMTDPIDPWQLELEEAERHAQRWDACFKQCDRINSRIATLSDCEHRRALERVWRRLLNLSGGIPLVRRKQG